jgi:ATP-dependent DNA helicase DinG
VSTTAIDMFAHGGPLARELGPRFEPRSEQLQMAAAVRRALGDRTSLMVEAGTGVGKSLAYLVPAIERIVASGGVERVVVATNTIALQEQILGKDVPLLQRVFAPTGPDGQPDIAAAPFRAELVKGRGNYVSVRRLAMASQRQEKLFLDEPARRSLHVIEDWAYSTTDGTLSTLPPIERAGIWDRVQSDSGNCMGKKCPTYEKCFYQSARRRMEAANLLICNHAVFFADLALRAHDAGFLPEYHHVILDEAHMVEDVACEHFGRTLSEGRLRHLIGGLWAPRRRKGFLASVRAGAGAEQTLGRCVALTEQAEDATDRFFQSLVRMVGGEVGSVRLRADHEIENVITPAFTELSLALKRLKDALLIEEDRYELNALTLRAASIADDASALCKREIPGCVYWVDVTAADRAVRVSLAASPIEVAPLLRTQLFGAGVSVVLTSATLTTAGASDSGERAGFQHPRSRLGADHASTLALGSPFDHRAQMQLHVDTTMPDPRASNYGARLAASILRHIDETDGGAFVLFTSFKAMHEAAASLGPALQERGHPVWVQGKGASRTAMLGEFRAHDRGVLFGTASFWQGVDVPGRALRNVIITRLPFDPPDRPLTQARLELVESRGGNPFMEESLPRAIIRFKQGFGRLIRTAGDSGRVVVLDPRLVTARYGRLFLQALPEGVKIIGMPGAGDDEYATQHAE